MKRWGLALAAFGIVVAALLLWRATRDEASPPPVAADAGAAAIAAPSGTPTPRVARPADVGAASIAGTVRDVATRPIAGARVCARIEERTDAADAPCTATDAAGAYTLAAPLTTHAIVAGAPRFRPGELDVPPLAPGEARAHIDLVLRDGQRLRGRVVDTGGAPIAGAHVTSVITVTTGADGAFELWGPPTKVMVHARADGHAPAREYVAAPAEVVLVLHAASSIAGIVVDDATGEAVAGAQVHTGSIATVADDEGRFELDGLGHGRVIVQANTPDRSGRTFEINLGLAERLEGTVIRLHAAHQLSVRLLRPDTQVCTDPHVELDTWGTETGVRWRDGDVLRFDGVPPNRYVLTSSCGGKDRTVHPPIDVRADVLFEITGTARPTGRLVGTIHAAGRDTETVRVWATGARRKVAEIEAGGSYELELDAGRYEVVAGGESPETPPAKIEIVAGRDTTFDARLADNDTGRLVVTVVDAGGAPLPDVFVGITRDGRIHPLGAETSTDRDGRLAVRLPPGTYEVVTRTRIERELVAPVAATVVTGAERAVRIVITEPGIQIRGVVVDGGGAPVAGAVVVDRWARNAGAGGHAISGADGTFVIPRRRHDLGLEVIAFRPGGGESRSVSVRGSTPLRLVIEVPASVAGTVAMADGSAPTRFEIVIKHENHRVTRSFLHTGGAFAIASVPSGPVKLAAAINGIEVWSDLTLAVGERRTGLALTLAPVASVTGRVLDASDRSPIAGVKLNLMCTRADGERLAFSHADQRSGADGRFQIRELPPGPCAVEAYPPSSTWLRSNHTLTVPERGTGDVGDLEIARAR